VTATIMRVSYLIPLYNHARFIHETISSVVSEASRETQIEICVSDDGSTDGGAAIVSAIEPGQYCTIKVCRSETNRGKVAALNAAFEMSTGEMLFVLGSDDIAIPGRTEALLALARETGKSTCGGFVKRTHPLTEDLECELPVAPNPMRVLIENKYSGGCMCLWRKDAEVCFPIPQNLRFEDWWISFQLTRRHRVAVLRRPVLIYRIHGANDFGSAGRSVESVARDFSRHEPYFEAFERTGLSSREAKYLQRARDLRSAYRGEGSFLSLFRSPRDRSLLLLAFTVLWGARGYLWLTRIWRNMSRIWGIVRAS
jgi:glycosyltransferase involved in cell wall biosynthesis